MRILKECGTCANSSVRKVKSPVNSLYSLKPLTCDAMHCYCCVAHAVKRWWRQDRHFWQTKGRWVLCSHWAHANGRCAEAKFLRPYWGRGRQGPPQFWAKSTRGHSPWRLRRHHHCMITTWPPTFPILVANHRNWYTNYPLREQHLIYCTVVKPAFIKASIKRLMCACTTWPTPMKWMQSAIRMRYEDEIIAAAVLTVQYWTRIKWRRGRPARGIVHGAPDSTPYRKRWVRVREREMQSLLLN